MGKKQVEDAVINVVINGEKAISSFRELNQLRREQAKLVETLNKNSPEYAQQQRRLEDLNAAHKVWRAEINNSTAAIDRMNEEMGETSKNGFFDKMKSMFSKDSLMVAGGNLIADGFQSALGAVKSFVNGSEAAYIEAVKGQAQLDAALKSTGGVAGETKQSLNDLAGALMDQTGIDDDVISKSEEMMLTFTNVRGKIYEQSIPAIVDMTSAMNQGTVSMEGIQAQTIQVGKALNDPIKGISALAKVGVTFTEQQKEQIKTLVESNHMMDAQAIILQELSKEFGGTAKAIADTDVGAMQKFETRLGNIQENIGGLITGLKGGMASAFDPFLKWVEKATSTPLPDKIREEQTELNALVGAVVSCNDNQTVRNALIAELQSKYPDFLGNIKAEDAANDVLLRRLTAVNEQYKERIFIAVNQDKIKEIQEGRSKAVKEEVEGLKILAAQSGKSMTDLAKLNDAQLEKLAKDNIKRQIDLTQSQMKLVSGEDKAHKAYEAIMGTKKKLEQSYKDEADLMAQNGEYQKKMTKQELANIDLEIAALNKKKATEKDVAKAKREQAEIDRLQKKKDTLLGVIPAIEEPTSGGKTKAETDAAEKKALAAREKAAKELTDYRQNLKDAQAEVNKFMSDATKGTADNLDAQLQVINDKYAALIDKLKKLKADSHTDPDSATAKKLDGQIGALEHTRDNEKDGVKATVNYNAFEQTVNDDAERQVSQAKDDLANHLITEEDFAASELLIEQQRLTDLFDLRTLFGMQTLDLENKLADGRVKSDKKAFDSKMKILKEQQKGEEEYQRVQKIITAQKAELAETGVQILAAAFGKSKGVMLAQLALEKAIAISKIITAEGVEIAGYYAHPASILSFGASGTVLAAAAKVRAGLSIAQIVASGLLQGASIAGSDSGSGNSKKFARGGILPDGPSHANGGLNLVDPYGMVYGNVEGGEPILSKDTYTNNRSLVDALLNSNGRQLNLDRIQDATMSRERRVSNVLAATETSANGNVSSTAAIQSELNLTFNALLNKMDTMAAAFSDQEIIFSNRAFEDDQRKKAKIRNDANA